MNGKSLFSGFVLKKLKATHVLIFVLLNLFLWAFHFFLFRPTSIDMYEMRSNPLFNAIFSLRDFFPDSFYLASPFRRFSFVVIFANLIALELTGFNLICGPMKRMKEWIEAQCKERSILFSIFWTALVVFPMGLILYLILNYSFTIPYMDTWVSIGYIEKYFSGKLTFSHLCEWHGAGFHRNFFPRALEIIVADLFHWQFVYINLATFFLAGLTFLLLVIKLGAIQNKIFTQTTLTMIPLVSIVIFSARLTRTWVWDQGFASYICIFPVVLAFFLMTVKSVLSWKRIIFAFCLGVISNSSFTAGVVFWPVGLLLILFADNQLITKRTMLAVWIMSSIIFIKLYFTGYYGVDSEKTGLFSFLHHGNEFLNYFWIYLGGTFPSSLCARIFGLFGIIYFGYRFSRAVVINQENDVCTRFFLALGSFAMIAGLLISVGRYKGGAPGALSFNYANFSNLFFISNLGLLAIQMTRSPSESKFNLRATFIVMILTFLVHSFSFLFINVIIFESKAVNQYRNQLLKGENLSELLAVSQTPKLLPENLAILKKRNLNIFYAEPEHH